MTTQYIFTEKAEQIARENNIPEYRKAGTAAYFAYKPLEDAPQVAKAWIEAGIIEKIEKPINFLTFTFRTTANSHMIKLFKENNIKWFFNGYAALYADINKTGEPVHVDCFHIARDEQTGLNLFEVKAV
jgi:hypothetical protein